MLVAGIMTGTSLDAIDVAVCDIQHKGDRHAISLVAFSTHPYADETIAMIRAAVSEQATMEALSDIPFALARDYAAALSELVTSHAIEARSRSTDKPFGTTRLYQPGRQHRVRRSPHSSICQSYRTFVMLMLRSADKGLPSSRSSMQQHSPTTMMWWR